MERFNVGRMTARVAINALVQENVVTRKPGCGTFLTDPKEWIQPRQTQATQYKVLLAYQDMSKTHACSDDSHLLASIHEAMKQNGMEASLLSLPENGEPAYRMLSQYLKTHNPDGVIMHAIGDERLYELVEHLPAIASDIVLFSHVVGWLPCEAKRQIVLQ